MSNKLHPGIVQPMSDQDYNSLVTEVARLLIESGGHLKLIADQKEQLMQAAAFLDGMARSLATWGHEGAAGECREMAQRLKGEGP